MKFQDLYELIGVRSDASADEIKRAYRKLARKTHPEISKLPEAQERFQALTQAYEILGVPEKRAAYDRSRFRRHDQQAFGQGPDWRDDFEFGGWRYGERHESVYGAAFGGGDRGTDIYTKVLIDLEDAYGGTTRDFVLKRNEIGTNGHVKVVEQTLSVRIPRGIRAGQHIRLAKQGAQGGNQGRRGDLYLEVDFTEHPVYRVDGCDVYMDLPIAPWEAALGASIQVPTPSGEVQLSIPKASQSGRLLRLPGSGIPSTTPGDFFVRLQVVLPPANSSIAKQAYQTFADAVAFNPREPA